MVAVAKLSTPAASRTLAAVPATDLDIGVPPQSPADSFARDGSSRPAAPAARVQADPELQRQTRAQLMSAHLGNARGVQMTHSDRGDLGSGDVTPAQTAFRGEMRTALGRNVANPPSERDLREYFRSFRGKPEEAIGAYERYADAYARHDGEHDYRSRDRQYVLDTDGRVLGGRNEAERLRRQGHNYTYFENNAPNDFREATRDRAADRRSQMDCEGYAVMAGSLLGEAGLNTSQVVGNTSSTDGHAVAVARDAASGRSWVLSNGDAYAVNGNLRSTLDRAYGDTTMRGLPSTYYQGRSQDEAAFRQMRQSTDGRID